MAYEQIEAKPSTTSESWSEPFENAFKDLTKSVTEFVGNHAPITDSAKNNLNSYVDSFKSELSSLAKTVC